MAKFEELKSIFEKLHKNNTISHSYLIFGDNRKAEKRFFNLLGSMFEGESSVLIDALFLDARSKSGIDDIREIKSFLYQKPIKSNKRSVFINWAENLTLAAENAILKIIEEPPEHGAIFLGVKSPHSLISPLVSRCQKFYLFSEEKDLEPDSESEKKAFDYVSQFKKLKDNKSKSEIFKSILEEEDDKIIYSFVKFMLEDLKKDFVGNFEIIKELNKRFVSMNEFNLNKKLQLEAALLY